MTQWTPELVSALGIAISGAIAAIFSKNVVDAVIRLADWWRVGRERRLAQRALDDELNDKGYKYIIRRQDRRISELEEENKQFRQDHLECREENATITSELARLRRRIDYLENEKKKRENKASGDTNESDA